MNATLKRRLIELEARRPPAAVKVMTLEQARDEMRRQGICASLARSIAARRPELAGCVDAIFPPQESAA